MDTPNPNQSPKPNPDPTSPHVNPFLKAIIVIAVFVVMPFYESAKSLMRKTYSEADTPIPIALGVIASLASGIFAGYYLGWVQHVPIWEWLLVGIVAALAGYIYLYPIIHLAIAKQALRLSRELWDSVDGSTRSHSWFTHVLMGLGYVTLTIGALYFVGYSSAVSTHAHMVDWGWWSWIAFVVAAVVGLVSTAITCCFGYMLLYWTRLAAITVASSIGFVLALRHLTTAFIAGHEWNHNWVGVAYLVEWVIFIAYIFPLVHIIMTHGVQWLFDLLENLYDQVYEGPTTRYTQFFHQVFNLVISWYFGHLSLLLLPMAGISNFYLLHAGAAVVAVLTYLICGKVLKRGGNLVTGILISLYVAGSLGLAYSHAGLWFGVFGAIVVAAMSFLLSLYIAFPIVYLLVGVVADPLLASWLSKPLVWIYDQVSYVFENIFDELFHAYENAYGDILPEEQTLFLHLFNLVVAVAVYFGSSMMAHSLGFGLGLTIGTIVLGVGLSYVLVGKLLLNSRIYLVGILSALGAGVYSGVLAHAATQSHSYATWIVWVISVVVGLVASAITFGVTFPWFYVFVRAALVILASTKWLLPVLAKLYNRTWNIFSSVVKQFVETYKQVRESIKPTWQSAVKMYRDILQEVQTTWHSFKKNNRGQ